MSKPEAAFSFRGVVPGWRAPPPRRDMDPALRKTLANFRERRIAPRLAWPGGGSAPNPITYLYATVGVQTDELGEAADTGEDDTKRNHSDGTADCEDGEDDDALLLLGALDDAEQARAESTAPPPPQPGAAGKCGACCRIFFGCRRRLAEYIELKTRSLRGGSEALRWALRWMQREYPDDFRRCMFIIVANALFCGAAPVLSDQLLGAVIPNLQAGQRICYVDLVLFGAMLLLGQVAFVWSTYKLNISKMDGAGFLPLFQQQLAKHISALPQSLLDGCNESEIMTMLEKDVNALNDVIASWFDLVSSSLELLILIPFLFLLSLELSLFVILVIPPFIVLQLRSGRFIVRAANDVRTSEVNFVRFIEENIVFASTRKLLGLGKTFDRKLEGLQEVVVEKFDVLDLFEARSQKQIDAFSFCLSAGVFAAGCLLLGMEVTDSSPLVSVSMPSTCMLMQDLSIPGCTGAPTDPSGCPIPKAEPEEVAYRIDLSTLFAYYGAVQGVFPICAAFIGSIRKIQVGISSCAYHNNMGRRTGHHALSRLTQPFTPPPWLPMTPTPPLFAVIIMCDFHTADVPLTSRPISPLLPPLPLVQTRASKSSWMWKSSRGQITLP